MKTHLLPLAIIFTIHTAFSQFDISHFKGIKARSIGPAGMSGRIIEVTAGESRTVQIFSLHLCIDAELSYAKPSVHKPHEVLFTWFNSMHICEA